MTEIFLWNKWFFLIIMHPVWTKNIYLPCRNYYQQKTCLVSILKLLYFNELTENISLWPKAFCIVKETVMAEIIFLNRNFSKIFFENWHSWSELCSYCNSIKRKKLFYISTFYISLTEIISIWWKVFCKEKNGWW